VTKINRVENYLPLPVPSPLDKPLKCPRPQVKLHACGEAPSTAPKELFLIRNIQSQIFARINNHFESRVSLMMLLSISGECNNMSKIRCWKHLDVRKYFLFVTIMITMAQPWRFSDIALSISPFLLWRPKTFHIQSFHTHLRLSSLAPFHLLMHTLHPYSIPTPLFRNHQIHQNHRPRRTQQHRAQRPAQSNTILPSRSPPPIRQCTRRPNHRHRVDGW